MTALTLIEGGGDYTLTPAVTRRYDPDDGTWYPPRWRLLARLLWLEQRCTHLEGRIAGVFQDTAPWLPGPAGNRRAGPGSAYAVFFSTEIAVGISTSEPVRSHKNAPRCPVGRPLLPNRCDTSSIVAPIRSAIRNPLAKSP